MPINYRPTFAEPTEYERQIAEARRRQAMAEALEAQAYRPLSGSDAPTPAAAPLVAALQSFMSARQRKKAMEAATKAEEMESTAGRQIAGRLSGGLPMSTAPGAESPSDELTGVSIQSPYRRSAEDAMNVAMTPVGTAALRRAPMLAAALERSITPADVEEFYAPTATAEGFVQFGKRGGKRDTGYKAPEGGPEAVTPTTIVKDGRRIVVDARTGREIGAAPESSPLVVNYGSPVAGVDEQGNPVFFQPSKGGGAPAIVPGVRPSPKGMNESQAKAAGFADRIAEASPMLDIPPPTVGSMILSDVPGGNFALNPQQQKFFQAERNFINAVLRRESGAVISPDEFSNARKQYIPQPGDSDGVLEQKRRNRETVLRSLSRDAGPSYQPVIDLPPR